MSFFLLICVNLFCVDVGLKLQFERYEKMQEANEKNFVSFDEERRKQAEVFANSLDYNPFRQANKQGERLEYGNALKR